MRGLTLTATGGQTGRTKSHRHGQQHGGHQGEGGEDKVKGVECMVAEGDLTSGGGHIVPYTEAVLQNRMLTATPEIIFYQLSGNPLVRAS